MIFIPCRNGTHSIQVPLENVNDAQYQMMRQAVVDALAQRSNQDAIQHAFEESVAIAPEANPSDLWRHVLMGEYIASGRNDNSWKKASGRAKALSPGTPVWWWKNTKCTRLKNYFAILRKG